MGFASCFWGVGLCSCWGLGGGCLVTGAHTPGPWVIRTLENFGFNVVHYVGGDKFDILRVAKTSEEANARLIAAAPELLAALQALFNSYKNLADSGDAGYWSIEDQPEGKQALAALAAAQPKEINP